MKYIFRCPECGIEICSNGRERCDFCHSMNIVVNVGYVNCDVTIDNFYFQDYNFDIIFTEPVGEINKLVTIVNYGPKIILDDNYYILKGESLSFLINDYVPVIKIASNELNYILDWNEIIDIFILKKDMKIVKYRRYGFPRNIYPCEPKEKVTIHKNFAGSVISSISFIKSSVHSLVNMIKEKYTFSPITPHFNSLSDSAVYSSIFAPAEVKRDSHMLIQIYFHLHEDLEEVISLAKESDKNAKRRDYIPLSLKLKKGDKISIEFNIYGKSRLMTERKSVIWQGIYTKCSFDYFVPNDINVNELSCEANLFVNDAMIGEMRFLTKIVEFPTNLNSEILSHRFNKIFISYAHQDSQQAKLLSLAYQAQGIDYFFDRDCLAPGDIYEEKIFKYIDTSDLFVLCWSKNAALSEYVSKEKKRALLHAYPQVSIKDATLKIFPISIEPRAELPSDMKKIYNFVEI